MKIHKFCIFMNPFLHSWTRRCVQAGSQQHCGNSWRPKCPLTVRWVDCKLWHSTSAPPNGCVSQGRARASLKRISAAQFHSNRNFGSRAKWNILFRVACICGKTLQNKEFSQVWAVVSNLDWTTVPIPELLKKIWCQGLHPRLVKPASLGCSRGRHGCFF